VTLWKEHLGIKERHREKDKEQERDLMRTICDPVVGYDYWKAISKQNSLAFAKLFPWTPQVRVCGVCGVCVRVCGVGRVRCVRCWA
jgi:ferredoxin